MSRAPTDIISKHWTAKGVLSIRLTYLAGSMMYELFLDDRKITVGTFANLLSQDVAAGKLDDKLGFSAQEAGVPPDYWDWDQGRMPL